MGSGRFRKHHSSDEDEALSIRKRAGTFFQRSTGRRAVTLVAMAFACYERTKILAWLFHPVSCTAISPTDLQICANYKFWQSIWKLVQIATCLGDIGSIDFLRDIQSLEYIIIRRYKKCLYAKPDENHEKQWKASETPKESKEAEIFTISMPKRPPVAART